MSTVNRERGLLETLPPLAAGQRLHQPAFHLRYESMPDGTWAELVGGIVRMPSPLRSDHGEFDDLVGYGLGHYRRFALGLRGGKNSTVILDESGEVQPDSQLRIPHEFGGQSRLEDGYIVGAPELVVEVSRSSRLFDLNEKKMSYERAGVREYLVVELEPDFLHWFILRDGRFHELEPDAEGTFRSEAFPGLWLNAKALYAQDIERLVDVVEQGLATADHAEFVSRLGRMRA